MNRSKMGLFIAFLLIHVSAYESVAGEKWYIGGTLHKANALEWQEASYRNKLATCGDFLAAYMTASLLNESITSKIRTTDDFKPYAIRLMNELDTAFRRDPDDTKNKLMFSNQEVARTAGMIAILSGWAKTK